MNILREYTLEHIRRSRKNSVAIMVAILIATTMLSALSGFLYTMVTDEIQLTIIEKGNWHAALPGNTPGDKLNYVTGHPNVEAVMIRGPWETAEIDDPRRPYLMLEGLTESYWNNMPERDLIMSGRIPRSKGEIVVSKQYMENHPDLNLGDTLHLSVGDRTVAGSALNPQGIWQEGEVFVPKEERDYALVGVLDSATSSMTPTYLAYTYLDEADILPGDRLAVYLQFKNPRTVYEDINGIARSVGFEPDGQGSYQVETNDSLLAKYFIFSPEQKKDFNLQQFSQPLMFVALGLLVAGLFVFIINNAFAMSANARQKQLGMLQSIGASPKQIRHSVIFEGLILAVIPIPLGLLLGWALDYSLFAYINAENFRDHINEIVFTFGWPAVLPSVLLALLTVGVSALIPARKIARLSPLESIRQGGALRVKRMKTHRLTAKLFGFEGELARNTLYARRRSYRTAAISLTLSFLLLSGFLNLMAITRASNQVYYDDNHQYDITLDVRDGNPTGPEFEAQIRSVAGIKDVLFLADVPAGLLLSESLQSDQLAGIGGLTRIADDGKYAVYQEEGQFRIRTNLIGLDDASFAAYCARIGADPTEFYDAQTPRTIVVNQVEDDVNGDRRNTISIPFLKLKPGELLNYEEKIYPEDAGGYAFQTEVGYLTETMPIMEDWYGNYQLIQVMPRSVYLGIIQHFAPTRAMNAQNVSVPIMAQGEELIEPVLGEIGEICDNWYGSGDYMISNPLAEKVVNDKAFDLLNTVILCVSGFLAMIGISNVFSTVSGNLQQRQKEFAMLRSAGLSQKGMGRMLTLEGLFFGIMPILLSIPLNVILIGVFLKINLVYVSEFLPYLPLLSIGAFGAVILLSVVLAYALGRRKLRQDTIVDVLKDEAV